MAGKDEGEEKTLPPSAKKLRDLRTKEGQVPHSKDFGMAVSTVAALATVLLTAKGTLARFVAALDLGLARTGAPFDDVVWPTFTAVVSLSAAVMLPPLVVASLTLVLASALDSGGVVVSPKALTPNFGKLNPVTGIKNLFGVQALSDLGKSLVKAVATGACVYLLLRSMLNPLLWAPTCGAPCALGVAVHAVGGTLALCAAIMLVAGVVDLKLARLLFLRDNKMSITDRKREQKEDFGDPHVRGERRRIRRELATEDNWRGIGKANLILVSGEALVGVVYIKDRTAAPYVTARLRGEAAREALAAARARGVKVSDAPGLTEDLLRDGRPGDYIPNAYFTPVATLLVRLGMI